MIFAHSSAHSSPESTRVNLSHLAGTPDDPDPLVRHLRWRPGWSAATGGRLGSGDIESTDCMMRETGGLLLCCPHHVCSSFPILHSQDYTRLVADYQLPLTAADEIYTRVVKERLAGLDSWSHEGGGIFHSAVTKSHEPGRSMTTICPVLIKD